MSNVNSSTPHGAEAAPQAGDVSGAVVPEKGAVDFWPLRLEIAFTVWCAYSGVTESGYWREYWWNNVARTPMNKRWFDVANALIAKGVTLPLQESTASASSQAPEVTGA